MKSYDVKAVKKNIKNEKDFIILPSDHGSVFLYIGALLKLFIIFACGMSLVCIIVGIIESIDSDKIIMTVFYSGFTSAIIFVILIGGFDVMQKIKNYFKYQIAVFEVKQKRTIKIKGSYKEAFLFMHGSLEACPEIEIIKYDMNELTIEGMTRRSWKSFGELINVRIENSTDKMSTIQLYSKPKMFFTIVDYCKNFENIEMIVANLKKLRSNRVMG